MLDEVRVWRAPSANINLVALMTSLLLGLLLGVAALQSSDPSLDGRLAEPHLVEIEDGRRLNFFCIGEGAPVVLFEQGGEGNIANWKAVQPAISALTRTCFYDRAGFGYSDPPAEAVTALSVTDDLRALLKAEQV
ncbi:MAG: alpha/beta fold hydrolase, partial [Alphaproteobacteria bacterium]